MKTITMTLPMAIIFIISAQGQGFQDLNFESAYNLPGNPGNGVFVSVTNALPSWTAYNGDNVLSDIFYASNSAPGAASLVMLEGGSLALSGNSFSVGLYESGSISQTGMVPADAESLEFEAQGPGPGFTLGPSGLALTLGGQDLSFSALFEGPDYIVYGANIPSDMDGQMEALAFSCPFPGTGNVLLDNIEFSTTGVPEPGEFGLIGVGAFLVAVHRRRGLQR